MILNDNGKPVANLHNALTLLRTDPNLQGQFAFDEMARCAMRNGKLLTDFDLGQIQEYMQVNGMPRMTLQTVHQAIQQVSFENRFHPVRDYLNGLEWDGIERLDKWLTTYCKAEASPYSSGVGKAFLISAVARIFQPGCKADAMLVLEGEQGVRKSTAVRILGGEWFSDALPPVARADKDLAMHLRGKWFVELPEMAAMRKAEDEALKSFIARQVEIYRPPFGREDVHEPRQCVFVGTTNKSQYLRDETGSRRYWPVRIGVIDTDALESDRDQLYAEAALHYHAGVQWWPDEDLARHARTAADARYEEDPWQVRMEQYLAQQRLDTVTVNELLTMSLGLMSSQVGVSQQRRVGAILKRMGWEQRQVGKDRVRTYFRPTMEG